MGKGGTSIAEEFSGQSSVIFQHIPMIRRIVHVPRDPQSAVPHSCSIYAHQKLENWIENLAVCVWSSFHFACSFRESFSV